MDNIVYESPDLFKQTSAYKKSVINIKRGVRSDCLRLILDEKIFVKKILVILKSKLKIYFKIKDLTSKYNLY